MHRMSTKFELVHSSNYRKTEFVERLKSPGPISVNH
jgi:hypothetical protein